VLKSSLNAAQIVSPPPPKAPLRPPAAENRTLFHNADDQESRNKSRSNRRFRTEANADDNQPSAQMDVTSAAAAAAASASADYEISRASDAALGLSAAAKVLQSR
jgi:hypothetical protein